jgi:hypothetical protein
MALDRGPRMLPEKSGIRATCQYLWKPNRGDSLVLERRRGEDI